MSLSAPAASKTTDLVTTNRAKAIKKEMLNLLENDEDSIAFEANDNTLDMSCEDFDEPQTKNPKGHPSIAVKQPRQRRATIEECATQPEEESINVTETLHCVNCFVLEARIKFLENHQEECTQITVPVTESSVLPKPGFMSETEAVKNKMVKLVDGHQIYLFEHQKVQCLKKGADPKKPGQRDEQRLAGTFSNGNTKYQRLCPKTESAIVDFCAAYSASSKGEVRDAMYSSVTSLRASKMRKNNCSER